MIKDKRSQTWRNYSEHLESMMKELMVNEDFADVTLVTEDKKCLKANSHVLSACSPVLKEIFNNEKYSRTIMYLRGIQFSEMEAILQFIYLGEATFQEERTTEFLAVGRSLEIKGLGPVKTETNYENFDEPFNDTTGADKNEMSGVEDTICEKLDEKIIDDTNEATEGPKNKYDCRECNKTYTRSLNLKKHKKSVHQGLKHACSMCDYHVTNQGTLARHIQTKHEGIRYACGQCNYKATRLDNLNKHIKNKRCFKRKQKF